LPPVYEARTSWAGKFLVARLSRNHTQRAQRLLVKLARVFPHPYNRPNHAPHFFLAKSPHFAHHARILLLQPHPRTNFLNKLSYTKRFVVCNAPSLAPGKNPCALYPLASFLYRASLTMAMNRIANSAGSSGPGRKEGLERSGSRKMTRNGAFLSGPAKSAEQSPFGAICPPKSAARQILIHGSAIKRSSILLQINHLTISNRRQTAPFSRALRAQKRESNESQSAR